MCSFSCHVFIFNIHFHKSSDIFIISIMAMPAPQEYSINILETDRNKKLPKMPIPSLY